LVAVQPGGASAGLEVIEIDGVGAETLTMRIVLRARIEVVSY